jgi:SAM-dependent methyltransferase
MRPVSDLQREASSCGSCGSSVRYRGVIRALSLSLFGQCLDIREFPARPEIVGWGMTDWDGYATRLSKKFSYTNTFYHTTPFLDIMAISESDLGTLDFLISSDVFEHVTPPVMNAFSNARRLLKPDGVFVLTVPYVLEGDTLEHFPNLHTFTIFEEGDDRRLVNITFNGARENFSNLIFHGGAGSTLEMRVFAKNGLLSDLRTAGFSRVSICTDPCFEHGVFFWEGWSLPIIARP